MKMKLPIVVWLMPLYFRDVPIELREAAIMDSCSEVKALHFKGLNGDRYQLQEQLL
jgi:ABC-type glycerol-3-phosphate transport system permease component